MVDEDDEELDPRVARGRGPGGGSAEGDTGRGCAKGGEEDDDEDDSFLRPSRRRKRGAATAAAAARKQQRQEGDGGGGKGGTGTERGGSNAGGGQDPEDDFVIGRYRWVRKARGKSSPTWSNRPTAYAHLVSTVWLSGGPHAPFLLLSYPPAAKISPLSPAPPFSGHRNSRTVKGVSFLGEREEWVVSGSDCG